MKIIRAKILNMLFIRRIRSLPWQQLSQVGLWLQQTRWIECWCWRNIINEFYPTYLTYLPPIATQAASMQTLLFCFGIFIIWDFLYLKWLIEVVYIVEKAIRNQIFLWFDSKFHFHFTIPSVIAKPKFGLSWLNMYLRTWP